MSSININLKKTIVKKTLNDKNNIKMLILIIVSLLILLSIFTFKNTIDNHINHSLLNNLTYRTFFIDIEEYNEEDITSKLFQIENVSNVFNSDERYLYLESSLNDINGEVIFMGSTNETRPILLSGSNLTNKYDVICPENFILGKGDLETSKIDKSSIINMHEHLGNNLNFNVKQYLDDSSTQFINESFELIITGIYKNSAVELDENICYVSHELIKEVHDKIYKNLNYNKSNTLILQVDNAKNIEKVINDVNNLGLNAQSVITLDLNFLFFIDIIMYIFLAIINFFIITVIYVIFKNNNKKIISKYNIMRVVGYKNSHIKNIVNLERNIMILYTGLIFIMIVLFLNFIYNFLLLINPYVFFKLPIEIPLYSIVISFLIIILAFIYFYNSVKTRLFKVTILEGLKNEE